MQKITFENLPSTNTPINATNLNAIQTNTENAINELTPVVLFSGDNSGTITLSDNYTNYSYIEVYGTVSYNSYDHVVSVYNKIDTSATNICDLSYVTWHSNDYIQTRYCYLTFSGTSVTHSTERYGIIRSNSSTGTGSSNMISVRKILGYK